MKFGLYGLHRGQNCEPETMMRLARLAEEAGFESVWVGDHIGLPTSLTNADTPRLEAVVALAYLAAVTTKVRLVAGIIVLPQRQPVLLAKQLSSIDNLAKGRLTVGLGLGYVEAELQALGVSLRERAARTDEYIAVMKTLWANQPATFAGRFVTFTDIVQMPSPLQQPHPPLIIGAQTELAYRRAVRVGNGWYGWQLDLEKTRQAMAAINESATRYERPRDLGELEITITPKGAVDIDTVRQYADLGVHRLTLQPSRDDPETMCELINSVGDGLIGRV